MNVDRKKRSRRRENGQGLVEFVLVFSMLVMLLCMAVDTARIVDAKILLQSAACESVRCITSKKTMSSEVYGALENDYDRLDSDRLEVNLTSGANQQRSYIYHAHNGRDYYGYRYANKDSYITYFDATVRLTYTVPVATPVGQLFFGKQKIISANYTKMIVTGGFQW
ncbi:MAG: pilus assembly protein [Ruminococcaceae bacterium]|jgi:Flp pilus assembly protein TadG|nr:pilus assembly protein [Oscillospiraceae bacterium]